jgi:alkanesulfonate monooxygenase SsuD/methylene tetrahydromethanopterin reductase-like flavin-dependent oxidoreductase (luciferase family)
VPYAGRLGRLADTVRRWRQLWRGDEIDGFPQPTAPDGPPVWFAGAGPRGLTLTSQLFDGWLPYLRSV